MHIILYLLWVDRPYLEYWDELLHSDEVSAAQNSIKCIILFVKWLGSEKVHSKWKNLEILMWIGHSYDV